MTDTERLRDIISKKGLMLKHIAKELGISRYSLSLKIENKNEFKVKEIKKLCEILDIKSLEEKESIFFAKEVD